MKKKNAEKKENLHEGHRKRMMDRFRLNGLDGFYPHEVLEILLFPILPRINTNPHGHRLINAFGSLKHVLEAKPEELVEVKGIGPASAAYLASVRGNVTEIIRKQYRGIRDLTYYDFAFLTDWFMRDADRPIGILLREADGAMVDFLCLPICRDTDGRIEMQNMAAHIPHDITNLEYSLFVRQAENLDMNDIDEIRRWSFGRSFILQEVYVMHGRESRPVLYPERSLPKTDQHNEY